VNLLNPIVLAEKKFIKSYKECQNTMNTSHLI
jgi:hypothetical protein